MSQENKPCSKNNPDKICCIPKQKDIKAIIKKLENGNKRYRKGNLQCFTNTVDKSYQKPYAAILSCSDSRVIPERVFDAGPGELFVARVAGNVVNSDILASFEYALKPLGTRLIIVLGHHSCGAVKAAINHFVVQDKVFDDSGYTASACLNKLINNIGPAVSQCISPEEDPLKEKLVIRKNAELQARKFLVSDCIAATGEDFALYYGYLGADKKVDLIKIEGLRLKLRSPLDRVSTPV